MVLRQCSKIIAVGTGNEHDVLQMIILIVLLVVVVVVVAVEIA